MPIGVNINLAAGKTGPTTGGTSVNTQAKLPHDGTGSVVNADLLSRLPYYLTKMACTQFPQWTIWNKLYGTVDWKANSGNIMRAVRHEPTPISEALVAPKAAMDPWPNKNVYNMGEMSEEALVCLHDFESKIFYFQPVWTDFLPTLEGHYSDINRQIGIYSDNFARTNALARVRQAYVVGRQGGGLINDTDAASSGSATKRLYADTITAPRLQYSLTENPTTYVPTAAPNTNIPLALSTTLKNIVQAIENGPAGAGPIDGLTLAALDDAVAIMRDDIGVPFFEGAVNVPRDNEVLAGRYLLVCSSEVWQMLKWDPHYSDFRDYSAEKLTNNFVGKIFNELTAHIEQFPLRVAISGDGNPATAGNTFWFPEPQVYQAEGPPLPGVTDDTNLSLDNPSGNLAPQTPTDLGYPKTRHTVRINPQYKNAKYEVAWLLGADFMKTIRVGPPPSAFSGKMSKKKFYSMDWNGQVDLTDQILIDRGSQNYELNVYGRYVKYIASLAMGAIPCNAYNAMPVFFKRRRPPLTVATP